MLSNGTMTNSTIIFNKLDKRETEIIEDLPLKQLYQIISNNIYRDKKIFIEKINETGKEYLCKKKNIFDFTEENISKISGDEIENYFKISSTITNKCFEKINNCDVLTDEININSEKIEIYYKILKKTSDKEDNIYNVEVDINQIDDFLLKLVNYYGEYDIGNYYCEEYFPNNQFFENDYDITVKEFFIKKVVECGLSYVKKECYEFLETIIFKMGLDYNKEYKDIRLSRLLGHRFDDEQYNLDTEKSSYISLTNKNLSFFTYLIYMIKFLIRKDSLDIDYEPYNKQVVLIKGKNEKITFDLVEPISLEDLHRNFNPKKDLCTYYNNKWYGNCNGKNHSNSIMAILSFIKNCLKPPEVDKTIKIITKAPKKIIKINGLK